MDTRFTFTLLASLLFTAALFGQTPLDTAWTISRNGGMEDEAWGICADDSNYLYWATFQKENAIKEQFVIYKLDENGNQIWESPHYGISWWNRAFAIKERGDYVYVAGTGAINGVLNGPIDAVVICYRKSDGDTVWINHYNQGYGYEEIDGMELQPDCIYLSGWTKSAGGTEQQDVLLLKMDYNGNFLDTAIWGSPGFDEANGEMVIDDSTIYIAGRWNATGPASLFDGEGLIASFNRSDLSFKDSATYNGGAFMDDALGLGTDGTYLYSVGYTTNFGNSQQLLLLKYDKNLNLLWDTVWGSGGNEFARGIIKGNDGNMLITGNVSTSPANPTDVFLMSLSPEGNILNYQVLSTDSADLSHNLMEHNGSVYITANTKSTRTGNYDAWLLKVQNTSSAVRQPAAAQPPFRILPNPTGNIVYITTSETAGNIELSDINGKILLNSSITGNNFRLDLSNYSPGIYFLKHGSFVKKVIKQ